MFFNYFNQIASPGVDYNLTISKTSDDRLVVILLPRVHDLDDPARHRIWPLKLTGTPQELDREFFPAIAKPIQKASGLLVDMAGYEKQLAAAAKESKAAKEKKETLSKEEKAKKEKFDGFIKKADELEAAGNIDGTLMQLQQARLHATDKAARTVDERIAAVKEKTSQGSLFEVPATPQPAAQTAPATQPAMPIPTFHNVALPQPATAIPAPAPVLERSPEAPAVPMTGNNHSTQPVGVPIAPKPTVYNEYDSAPRPADEEYPSYRQGEYSEYLDFAPPVGGAGTGMGAPTFL